MKSERVKCHSRNLCVCNESYEGGWKMEKCRLQNPGNGGNDSASFQTIVDMGRHIDSYRSSGDSFLIIRAK
jgi:hypothetical protein